MSAPAFLDGYVPAAGRLASPTVQPQRPFAQQPVPDRYCLTHDRVYDVPTDFRRYTPRIAERTAYTNYLTQSDNFGHTDWTKLNVTVTADNLANPWDGAVTSDKLLETTTNAEHRVSRAYTFTAVATTVWAIVRDIGRGYVRLRANDGSTSFDGFFDLASGSVFSKSAGVVADVDWLGDSFYRIAITFTPAAAAGNVYLNTSTNGSTVSFVGDVAKGIYLAQLQLERASSAGPLIQTTTAARTISSPDLDPVDPFAFLILESDPVFVNSEVSRVRRIFVRIPKRQTIPGSLMFPKPSLSGSFPQVVGGYRVFQPDATLLQYDAYRAQAVTSDSGAPTIYPTGGTYLLTFGADTTGAIGYNSGSAGVEAALDAIASVIARGGLAVSGAYNTADGFVITFTAHAQITADITSLTGSGTVAKLESLLNGGYTQSVRAYVPVTPTTTTKDLAALITTGTINDPGYGTIGNRQYHGFHAGATGAGSTFTGGTFTITIGAVTSAPIAYNATLAELQNALDGMVAGAYTAIVAANYYNPYDGLTYTWTAASILSTNNASIAFTIQFDDLGATGGTYTLTAFTQTTAALAYDATAGTVQSALNGLANVAARGNCVVAGNLTDGFTISFTNAALTTNPASLTPTGCTATIAIIDGGIGRVQRLTFNSPTQYRDLFAESHGLTLSDVLFVKVAAGPAYYSDLTNFTLPDADTIRFTITPSLAWAAAVSITEVGKRTKVGYAAGSSKIRCRRVTDFYLPGVTLDVDTADDIVLPANQGDGPGLLLAIFAGAGAINYEVGDITPWRESPLLGLGRTEVDAIDI